VESKVVVNIPKARKEKEMTDASSAHKTAAASKGTMKWLPFKSTFIL
jgi:hypothetical protein